MSPSHLTLTLRLESMEFENSPIPKHWRKSLYVSSSSNQICIISELSKAGFPALGQWNSSGLSGLSSAEKGEVSVSLHVSIDGNKSTNLRNTLLQGHWTLWKFLLWTLLRLRGFVGLVKGDWLSGGRDLGNRPQHNKTKHKRKNTLITLWLQGGRTQVRALEEEIGTRAARED